jgi:hypothetical protein
MNNYFELNLPNYEEVRKDFCDSLLRMNSFVSTIDEYIDFHKPPTGNFVFVPTYLSNLGTYSTQLIEKISKAYGSIAGSSFLIYKKAGHLETIKSKNDKVSLLFPLMPSTCLYWSWVDYIGPEEDLIVKDWVVVKRPKNELLANRVDSYKQIGKPAFIKVNSYYSNINLGKDPFIMLSITFADQEKLENDFNNGTISI